MKEGGEGIKISHENDSRILAIAKGMLVSILITVPAFIIFAAVLNQIDFPEKFIYPAVVTTTLVSILAAGSSVSRKAKSRGWLNGGATGLTYVLMLYLVSSIFYNDYTIDMRTIQVTVGGVLTGCIGGIIGINFRKKDKIRRNNG